MYIYIFFKPSILADANIGMCDSLQKLLLFCAHFIFHNEEKKALDGKLNLMTRTSGHAWGDLSLITCWLFCLCMSLFMCVCVVLLIYSQPPRKYLQHSTCSSHFLTEDVKIQIKEHINRHTRCITAVLSQRMQGSHTNVAQGAFLISHILSSIPLQLETLRL